MSENKKKIPLIVLWVLCISLCGCGNEKGRDGMGTESDESSQVSGVNMEKNDLESESAVDGIIDFAKIQEVNPDIFAWIYIPGTNIDRPVLQSGIADDYYENRLSDGSEGTSGALYTEMANLVNMCDFNTIIHGKDDKEGDLFYDLHKFEDPDFLNTYKNIYVYLPDNLLTYEIFAIFNDEDSSILRRYDYTTYEGCQTYLEQLYDSRVMGKQIREGWEEVTPYHYLITLNGSIQESMQSQFVVIGALIGDAAEKIERDILD